jgi:GLPGLI family protein
MKHVIFLTIAITAIQLVHAQQKEGKVVYDRTSQFQIAIQGQGGDAPMPTSRTDRFELSFANNQMIWKKSEEEMQDDNAGSGMVIRTFGGGADDITYCDFEKQRKVESREFFDKTFIIADSIKKGSWKLSDETKTILDHQCRKAVSQRIGKKMTVNMQDGKMERKEVDDTSTLVAWFTMDIPVAAGPEVQGQLPGLILSLETNNGRVVYTAKEISPKAEISAIKEPTKGKKITQQEFVAERAKMMEQMQKNNPGGNFRMRVN